MPQGVVAPESGADSEASGQGPAESLGYGEDLHERPATVEGQSLREEAVRADEKPRTWGGVVDEFKDYLADKQRFKKQFSNAIQPMSHRFSQQYARDKAGNIYGADRQIIEEYDDLHCALITLKGHPWNAEGNGRSPADFLDELLRSNSNVLSAIRRHVDERFARITMLGAHQHGYPHIHHGVYVDGEVDVETFEPAIGSHLRNCPIAREQDHQPDGGAIRVWKADPTPTEHGPLTGLGREMASQLVGWGGIESASPGEQRFAALLWAMEVPQYRPGTTFRGFVSESQDPKMADDPGDFEGVVVEQSDGSQTTVPPQALAGGGGSELVEPEPLPREIDPKPNFR